MTDVNDESRKGTSEPGFLPALPTPNDITRNVAEWRAEVEARVAVAVANTLRDGRHPSQVEMRQIGTEGRRLYYDRLPKAALEGAPSVSGPISNKTYIAESTRSVDIYPAKPITKLLLNEVNWHEKQRTRDSYAWRASENGLWLMLLLISVATLVLHFVPNQGIFSRFSRLLEVL